MTASGGTNSAPSPMLIEHLAVLPEMQVRAKTDPGTVKRYAQAMKAGATFPPLLVAEVGAALVLVDGFHRVAALQALRRREALAVVIPAASLKEARWLAGRANLEHGLQLKPSERRRVLAAYVGAGQHRRGREFKSYREIAADVGGLPHSTVRNWIRKDFPSVFARMAGSEEDGWGVGGLPEPEPAERVFARRVLEALDDAAAALPGVTDPQARWAMLEKVEALRAALEEAGVEQPDF